MTKRRTPPKIVKSRHNFWNTFLRPLAGPFLRHSYDFHAELNRLKKSGPYLIISNHTADMDPLLLGLAFDFPIYYVASDQLLNKGFTSTLLRYFFAPIKKTKSLPDIVAIRDIKRILSEGGSVGIFAEGNVTLTGETIANIPVAIGKLIKLLDYPVIFYNCRGLSLSNPRWSRHRKKGPTFGKIKRIISPTEYRSMSGDELTELVKKEIYVNAYDNPEGFEYLGKAPAEGLERLVFMCPDCHQPFTLTTRNNTILCGHCGWAGTYDAQGYVNSALGKKTLIELNEITLQSWVEYLKAHQNIRLENPARIFYTKEGSKKRERKGRHTFELNDEGIVIHQLKKSDHVFPFSKIIGFAMQQKSKLIVYLRDGLTLFIRFRQNVSVYQYLVTMEIYSSQFRLRKGEGNYDYFANDDSFKRLGL